jgi:hypothetical protein
MRSLFTANFFAGILKNNDTSYQTATLYLSKHFLNKLFGLNRDG